MWSLVRGLPMVEGKDPQESSCYVTDGSCRTCASAWVNSAPLGSAPARLLCLLRAQLGALGGVGTSRVGRGHWALELAASKVAHFKRV